MTVNKTHNLQVPSKCQRDKNQKSKSQKCLQKMNLNLLLNLRRKNKEKLFKIKTQNLRKALKNQIRRKLRQRLRSLNLKKILNRSQRQRNLQRLKLNNLNLKMPKVKRPCRLRKQKRGS